MAVSPIRVIRPFHFVGSGRALRVGVTGGIGAGKTTVTSTLARLGAAVVSADDLVRDLQGAGGGAVDPIRQRFGDGVVTPDGDIDRKALASIVFADAAAREDLEHIVHPLVAERAIEFLTEAGPGQIAVYDVPLLIETHVDDYCDAIVVVWADVPTRLQRLRRDRGMSEAQAMARIEAQVSDAARERVAHVVIDNTVDPARVEEAVEAELWPALLAATGVGS